MPIDPNIALGFRQPEQPNMLAQMGQVMQLRQMQQENQQTNALNAAYQSAYAGGQYDPTAVERNLASGSAAHMIPKVRQQQAALEKAQAEAKKIGYDNTQSAFKQSSQMLTQIDPASPNAGAQLIAWHQANHTNPVMGPILKASGINANSSRADIESAIAKGPAAIQSAIQRYALGQEGFQKEVMQTERAVKTANIGAASGHRQASLAEQKYKDQLTGGGDIVVTTVPNPETGAPMEIQASRDIRTGQLVPLEVARMPMRVDISPNAATSSYQTSGGGGAPNTLATQVAPQGGAAPATNVNELRPQATTFAQPKAVIRQPVGVMKDGKAVFVKPEEAVGMQPASADAEKAARLQTQKVKDLSLTIKNLEDVTKPGGLISQSTGSGIGRAYDVGAGLFGQATEGAIATAKLAPIADMVLKMVPRFEGPQSDKDTQSYKEAAGQLANSNLPTKTRQEAGKEILRLMKEYKGQFVTDDMAKEGFGGAALTGEDKAAMDWANANPKDPRAAQIKQRLGG